MRAEVGSLAMAGGTRDPVLLGGDEMFVPGLPVTVQVVGAVQRPTAEKYPVVLAPVAGGAALKPHRGPVKTVGRGAPPDRR